MTDSQGANALQAAASLVEWTFGLKSRIVMRTRIPPKHKIPLESWVLWFTTRGGHHQNPKERRITFYHPLPVANSCGSWSLVSKPDSSLYHPRQMFLTWHTPLQGIHQRSFKLSLLSDKGQNRRTIWTELCFPTHSSFSLAHRKETVWFGAFCLCKYK